MTPLERLRALSCRLAENPQWVQAAGGNTSVKQNDTLWVKASGVWLSNANAPDAFVPVERAATLHSGSIVYDPSINARPSLETWMHLVIPQPWVVHTHALSVLSVVTREDDLSILSAALKGLHWQYIPYHKPGKALADKRHN